MEFAQLNVERQIKAAMEEFGTELHKNVASKRSGNFIFSPLSVHVLLSMAGYGARGSTAREIRRALRLLDDDTRALLEFQDFWDDINNVQDVVLSLANKIYMDKKVVLNDEYREISGTYFRSESEVLDFSRNSETAGRINGWCSAKTNGKIQQIITQDQIKPDSAMILLNAVYFKGDWLIKFDKFHTRPKTFYLDETSSIEVPTMYAERNFSYMDVPEFDFEAISLPYKNQNLQMVIIVPKKINGLEHIERNLEKFDLKFTFYDRCKVRLSLPKFTINTTHDLEGILSSMGLSEMFTSSADFSGISNTDLLQVDKVIQKAFIEVNEDGTEAAAVTAMTTLFGSRGPPPPPPKILRVDRPFMYKITYKNYTLFSGRVTNPNF